MGVLIFPFMAGRGPSYKKCMDHGGSESEHKAFLQLYYMVGQYLDLFKVDGENQTYCPTGRIFHGDLLW